MDEPFFRAAYDADAASRARQPWDEYAGWVRAFYEGKRFPPVAGWAKRERDLAARHPALGESLREAGRALAAEWAKDNAVRKVSTGDLQAWGARFERAAGNEAALRDALATVRAELDARLKA